MACTEVRGQGISEVATTLRVVGTAQATRRVARTSRNTIAVSEQVLASVKM